ncbi:hypothetical protein [Sediminitomix flava]|uniref:LTXXQ motif family protein n=1 Tax=Sediminitomix flava TaxID=379075 RepID=A0A315ZF31_SEDFL|nr:hypothetical protein [Sediminitomix flava]PWJ43344.1 hypothetical protein BC781_102901 [Sediminitomix flava]
MNKQTTLIALTFVFLGFFYTPTFAQNEPMPESVKEDLKMLKEILKMEKRDFFEQNMNIQDVEKADQFWALYSQYDKDRATIIGSEGKILKTLVNRGDKALTEKDNDELVYGILSAETKQAKLRKKYYKKIKKIDPKLAVRFFELDEFVSAQLKSGFLVQTPISSNQK